VRFLVVALLMDFAGAAISFPVPWIAKRLGANPLEIGIASASWSVTYTVFSFLWGHWVDRWGYKRLPILSLTLLLALCCSLPFTGNLYLLIGEAMAMGICFAMFWTPLITWLSRFVEPSQLGSVMSRFSIAWNAGAMLGMLLSGKLYEWMEWLPFGAGIALFVVAGWFLLPIPSTGYYGKSAGLEMPVAGPLVSRTFLYLAWLANFLGWCATAMVSGLVPELARMLQIGPAVSGVMLFMACASRVSILLTLQSRIGWQTRIRSLLLSEAVMAVGLLSVAGAHHLFWLAWGMMAIGAASGMAYLMSVHASLSAQARPGRNVGIHEMLVGAGSLVGPVLGGAIAKATDIRTPYRIFMAMVIGVMALQWLWFRLKERIDFRF